ncbi:hypothetical protein VM1G_11470 [Cytospora mali]|uniref:Uncharacterized protein n=1 Tax=Cytospora mali TaxID=578113 RepID=A0A194VUH3_CYTMA|nr:hypothetical protein VM1G_11470 [Valsa mali]
MEQRREDDGLHKAGLDRWVRPGWGLIRSWKACSLTTVRVDKALDNLSSNVSRTSNTTYKVDETIASRVRDSLPADQLSFWKTQALIITYRAVPWKYTVNLIGILLDNSIQVSKSTSFALCSKRRGFSIWHGDVSLFLMRIFSYVVYKTKTKMDTSSYRLQRRNVSLSESNAGRMMMQFQGDFDESLVQLKRSWDTSHQVHDLHFDEDLRDLACDLADTLRGLDQFEPAKECLHEVLERYDQGQLISGRSLLQASLAEVLLRLAIVSAKIYHEDNKYEQASEHWS